MGVPYKLDRRTSLSDAEIATFTALIRRSPLDEIDGLDVTGVCPTCEHRTWEPVSISIVVENVVLTAGQAEPPDQPDAEKVEGLATGSLRVRKVVQPDATVMPARRPILVTCRCTSEHAGAGAGFGCGATWMLAVSFTPGGGESTAQISRPRSNELALWRQVDQQQGQSEGALAAIRASASLWQKALAGFFALVSLPALVAGRDVMVKLNTRDVAWITAWVVAALTATAVATYWAHKASIGRPRVVTLFSSADITKAAGGEIAAAREAADTLRQAFWATAASLAFSFVALTVLWNADEKAAIAKPAGVVVVTDADGLQRCGELLKAEDRATIRLRPPAGEDGVSEPVDIAVAEVDALAAPESCP